jgi:hypothetical protein
MDMNMDRNRNRNMGMESPQILNIAQDSPLWLSHEGFMRCMLDVGVPMDVVHSFRAGLVVVFLMRKSELRRDGTAIDVATVALLSPAVCQCSEWKVEVASLLTKGAQ